jgi:predicted metal-binding protein
MGAEETDLTKATVTVFICITCKRPDEGGDAPLGRALVEAVAARVRENCEPGITIAAVECLAVCRRPCTIALAGEGKWTSVVGDLDPALHADDVVAAARAYQTSESGIIPWRQRPQSFRKGVVSRTPPIGFQIALRDPTDRG